MRLENFAQLSTWIGALAYLGLGGFFIYGWIRRLSGRVALIAAFVTVTWFVSLGTMGERPIVGILELSAHASWMLLIARVLGVSTEHLFDPAYRTQTLLAAIAGLCYFASATMLLVAPTDWSDVPEQSAPIAAHLQLGLALLGLIMLEQMFRNTRRDYRWNLKYLSIGLGVLFGYAFVLYADQVLFRTVSPTLSAAYGIVAAAAVPFIAIASLRSGDQRLNFNISRQFVFRSGVLIMAGLYLLAMGAAGYYVRFFGGEWGEVFQVLILAGGLIGLAVLATSSTVRNRVRVALLRNFFEYKYDYREEWLNVTRELTAPNPDDTLGQRAIHALGDLVHATSGRYFALTDADVFVPRANVRAADVEPISPRGSASLVRFWRDHDWIVDLDELRRDPSRYPGLDLQSDQAALATERFIVPLIVESAVTGAIVLGQPQVPIALIWEDYDILKVTARQAAAFLALKEADDELAAAEQFRAMDQISAFVIHDLKTITAQLGLLVRNAERHRNNPDFVADMVTTCDHAVARMNKLLEQLRSHAAGAVETTESLDFGDLVREAVEQHMDREPRPNLKLDCDGTRVAARRERLVSVIGHIIENAQQASLPSGHVDVTASVDRDWATVSVRDDGCGMSAEFIEHKLFAPFQSTKGLAGIGIGAYQSRAYLRSIGGDLSVRSSLGTGSEFTVRLPRVAPLVATR